MFSSQQSITNILFLIFDGQTSLLSADSKRIMEKRNLRNYHSINILPRKKVFVAEITIF